METDIYKDEVRQGG